MSSFELQFGQYQQSPILASRGSKGSGRNRRGQLNVLSFHVTFPGGPNTSSMIEEQDGMVWHLVAVPNDVDWCHLVFCPNTPDVARTDFVAHRTTDCGKPIDQLDQTHIGPNTCRECISANVAAGRELRQT